jgi:hypothetical protein
MVAWNWRRVVIATCGGFAALWLIGCASETHVIPRAPLGLSACASENPLLTTLTKIAEPSGELTGCFESSERVEVPGTPLSVHIPLEYAYAITLTARSSGPYTRNDVETYFRRIREEWQGYAPMWDGRKSVYEERIAALLQENLDPALPAPAISLERPLLVAIERAGADSYAVISFGDAKSRWPEICRFQPRSTEPR